MIDSSSFDNKDDANAWLNLATSSIGLVVDDKFFIEYLTSRPYILAIDLLAD